MIKTWRLFNFKAVRGDTRLDLAQLTLFTGVNSAGKSTVLQSMLMLAQTMQGASDDRALVLNGPLVQLGSFRTLLATGGADEILMGGTVAADDDAMSVEFALVFDVRQRSEFHPQLVAGTVTVLSRDSREPFEMQLHPGADDVRARIRQADSEAPVEEDLSSICTVRSIQGDQRELLLTRTRNGLPWELLRIDRDTGALDPARLPKNVNAGFNSIRRQFNGLRYVGPIREAPHTLYALSTMADTNDVGPRGEHTAAVFALRQDEVGNYPTMSSLPRLGASQVPVILQTRSAKLSVALSEWLEYIGVAASLQLRDMGAMGHAPTVTLESVERDLTHVGTGVSQVLPIVLMCLLAGGDSTVVVEQPEVHLHPAVQARLADFFLVMALSGRQVIVETHSEYIVNRLRYRVAAAAGDSLLPVVQIHFAEKKDGASTFRPLVLDRYGGIVDWPDGFFDDSQIEIEQILLAGADKMEADAARLEATEREGGDATGG
jgi:predicted ATPase